MTTTNHCLPFNGQQVLVVGGDSSNAKYSNLNLNQFPRCLSLNETIVNSKNAKNHIKNFQTYGKLKIMMLQFNTYSTSVRRIKAHFKWLLSFFVQRYSKTDFAIVFAVG